MHGPVAQTIAAREGRDVEPVDVLHLPAPFTNKMMVLFNIGFKACSVTFHCHLANQTGRRHGVQALINRCERGPRVGTIDSFIDFFGGGMLGVTIEIVQDGVTLRSATNLTVAESGEDFRSRRRSHVDKSNSLLRNSQPRAFAAKPGGPCEGATRRDVETDQYPGSVTQPSQKRVVPSGNQARSAQHR